MRRDIFPGFDVNIPRFIDWDLWARIVKKGHVGLYLPETMFDTIDHPERGITRNDNSALRALRVIRSKWRARSELTKKHKRQIGCFLALLQLYGERPDLRRTFPEAAGGDFQGLTQWAVNLIRRRKHRTFDLAYNRLRRYSVVLAEAEAKVRTGSSKLRNLEADKDRLNQELTQKQIDMKSLESQLATRDQEILKLNQELTQKQIDMKSLESQLATRDQEILKLNREMAQKEREAIVFDKGIRNVLSSLSELLSE